MLYVGRLKSPFPCAKKKKEKKKKKKKERGQVIPQNSMHIVSYTILVYWDECLFEVSS
jgi:hypothetical protein